VGTYVVEDDLSDMDDMDIFTPRVCVPATGKKNISTAPSQFSFDFMDPLTKLKSTKFDSTDLDLAGTKIDRAESMSRVGSVANSANSADEEEEEEDRGGLISGLAQCTLLRRGRGGGSSANSTPRASGATSGANTTTTNNNNTNNNNNNNNNNTSNNNNNGKRASSFTGAGPDPNAVVLRQDARRPAGAAAERAEAKEANAGGTGGELYLVLLCFAMLCYAMLCVVLCFVMLCYATLTLLCPTTPYHPQPPTIPPIPTTAFPLVRKMSSLTIAMDYLAHNMQQVAIEARKKTVSNSDLPGSIRANQMYLAVEKIFSKVFILYIYHICVIYYIVLYIIHQNTSYCSIAIVDFLIFL
jgi:hypothetical protein